MLSVSLPVYFSLDKLAKHLKDLSEKSQKRRLFCDVFKTSQIHLKKDVFQASQTYLKKDVYSMTSLIRLKNIS